ncbi:MAG: alkaline phosphatase, partial [Persicimonas sp.]
MAQYVRVVGMIVAALLLVGACDKNRVAHDPVTEACKVDDDQERSERSRPESQASDGTPKRVILLVADGMGAAQLAGPSYTCGEPLSILEMSQMGWMTTHSHEFVTTDSAASATAMATGKKTHFEGVSVEPGTGKDQEGESARHLETVLERAEAQDWKTGLVSTSRVVHATPAAFGAHRAHRDSYEGIASDYLDSGVDVLLGGGPRFFTERGDGRDLLGEFEEKGYAVADSADEIRKAGASAERMVGLPHDPDFPPAGDPDRAMDLGAMTDQAIDVLDRNNDEGFFLMVEGSQVDWRGHDLDAEGVVREMLDFDRAVRRARAYAAERDDTLVVVASDHETGGMTVLGDTESDFLEGALGGDEAVDQMTDWQDGSDADDPPPAVARMEMGDGEGADDFAPARGDETEWAATFAHLPLASRIGCSGPGGFSGQHTPSFVPVFAEGSGAEAIAAVRDNTE